MLHLVPRTFFCRLIKKLLCTRFRYLRVGSKIECEIEGSKAQRKMETRSVSIYRSSGRFVTFLFSLFSPMIFYLSWDTAYHLIIGFSIHVAILSLYYDKSFVWRKCGTYQTHSSRADNGWSRKTRGTGLLKQRNPLKHYLLRRRPYLTFAPQPAAPDRSPKQHRLSDP